MNWVRLAILAVILYACVGCAPLTEQEQYERQDRINQRLDIWNLCKAVYDQNGAIMTSRHNHDRSTASGRVHTDDEVRDDILVNNCMWIWKQYERRNNR
jgi:hypothetical protein